VKKLVIKTVLNKNKHIKISSIGPVTSSKIKQEDIYRTANVLLQKYIESPLLYKKRKFDIRLWVLLNQDMDLFIFK